MSLTQYQIDFIVLTEVNLFLVTLFLFFFMLFAWFGFLQMCYVEFVTRNISFKSLSMKRRKVFYIMVMILIILVGKVSYGLYMDDNQLPVEYLYEKTESVKLKGT